MTWERDRVVGEKIGRVSGKEWGTEGTNTCCTVVRVAEEPRRNVRLTTQWRQQLHDRWLQTTDRTGRRFLFASSTSRFERLLCLIREPVIIVLPHVCLHHLWHSSQNWKKKTLLWFSFHVKLIIYIPIVRSIYQNKISIVFCKKHSNPNKWSFSSELYEL